jgi:hypothetical protein
MGTIKKNKESPLPPLKKSKEKKVVSILTLECILSLFIGRMKSLFSKP